MINVFIGLFHLSTFYHLNKAKYGDVRNQVLLTKQKYMQKQLLLIECSK